MREIKYRVWTGSKMLEWEDLRHVALYDILEENHLPMSIYKALEYTGLHDKHGKEIWESDIVSLVLIEDAGLGHKTQTTATVEWDDEDTGFYYSTEYSKFPHAKPWYTENVEVIGNIYESPELLK